MIRLKNNSIFLHTPKTGGLWVKKMLDDNNLTMQDATGLHSTLFKFNPSKEKPFVFTFVRHPITWYEEWFKFQKDCGWRKWSEIDELYHHPCWIIEDCIDDDFNKCVEKIIQKCPAFVTSMYHLYTVNADFIGKQESLEKDFLKVIDMMGLEAQTSDRLINGSHRENPEWDNDLKNEVLKLEIGAIKRYGY